MNTFACFAALCASVRAALPVEPLECKKVKESYKNSECCDHPTSESRLAYTKGGFEPLAQLEYLTEPAASEIKNAVGAKAAQFEDMILTLLERVATLADYQMYFNADGTYKTGHNFYTVQDDVLRSTERMNNLNLASLDFTGKKVLIAGGTAGIGWDQAMFAAYKGATVWVVGRDKRWLDIQKAAARSTSHLYASEGPATGTYDEFVAAMGQKGLTMPDDTTAFQHPLIPSTYLLPQSSVPGYAGLHNVPIDVLDKISFLEVELDDGSHAAIDMRNLTLVDKMVDWIIAQGGMDIISFQQKTSGLSQTGATDNIAYYYEELDRTVNGKVIDGVLRKGADYVIANNPKRGVGSTPSSLSTSYEDDGAYYALSQLFRRDGEKLREKTCAFLAGSTSWMEKHQTPANVYYAGKMQNRGMFSRLVYNASGTGMCATVTHPSIHYTNQIHDYIVGFASLESRKLLGDTPEQLRASKAAMSYGKLFVHQGHFFWHMTELQYRLLNAQILFPYTTDANPHLTHYQAPSASAAQTAFAVYAYNKALPEVYAGGRKVGLVEGIPRSSNAFMTRCSFAGAVPGVLGMDASDVRAAKLDPSNPTWLQFQQTNQFQNIKVF